MHLYIYHIKLKKLTATAFGLFNQNYVRIIKKIFIEILQARLMLVNLLMLAL